MPEPTRHLALVLTKRGPEIDEAVRDAGSLERHGLKVVMGAEAMLFTKVNQTKIPWWIEFLNPIVPPFLQRARSSKKSRARVAMAAASWRDITLI